LSLGRFVCLSSECNSLCLDTRLSMLPEICRFAQTLFASRTLTNVVRRMKLSKLGA
jgi:hypothetical protein